MPFYCASLPEHTIQDVALKQDVQLLRGSTSIKADDVVNGSREATLGLLWKVFVQFQVRCLAHVYKLLKIVLSCSKSQLLPVVAHTI